MKKILLCASVLLLVTQVNAQTATEIGTYNSQSKYNRLPIPPATATQLGGVKIGSGISVTSDGTISASGGGGGYTLPSATSTVLGGVKIGSNLSVTSDGTLSANAPDLSTVLPLAGGTMTGSIAYTSSVFAAILSSLKFTNSYGDELDLQAQVGVSGSNTLIVNGNNHTPVLQLKSTIGSVAAISMNANATAAVLPSPTQFATLTGTGNAYACLDENGQLYRSSTACQ